MTATQQEQEAAPEVVLYDQDAHQAVRLEVADEGERVEVELHFRAFTDDQLFEFLSAKDDGDCAPACGLFRALLNGHNIQGEDGAWLTVAEVCDQLDARVQAAAIENGLLASYFPPLPKNEAKRLRLRKGDRYLVWPLAVNFNGQEIVTRHKLRQPTNEERQTYQKLFTLNRFIGRELCALYDKLRHSVEGYVGDKVPVNHKIAIVVQHFASHEEVLLGKSMPAPPQ